MNQKLEDDICEVCGDETDECEIYCGICGVYHCLSNPHDHKEL